MKIEKVEKQKEKIEEVIDKKRVAAYIRVSTDNEDQKTSIDSQYKYYLQKIKNNPNYVFAGIYNDTGISGGNAKKRNGFLKMMVDVERGKIDVILTKSISRFARNTLDTIKYVRFLKEHNVRVIFEEESIDTSLLQSELILTIISSVAQQEIINMSEHQKHSMHFKMSQGIITKNFVCYGYDFDEESQNFIINDSEAELVRRIYDLYLEHRSVYRVTQIINSNKIPTKKGHKRWSYSVIRGILINEAYIGNLMLGKKFVKDPLSKRKIVNEGQREKYYVKNNHEPIISKEIFNKVQEIFKTNSKRYDVSTKTRRNNLFMGKLKCFYCGINIVRKEKNKRTHEFSYMCANLFEDKNICPNSRYTDYSNLVRAIEELVKQLKKYKSKNENYLYIANTIKNINSKDHKKIIDELIEVIVIGDEYSPYNINIVLKNNNIIKKRIYNKIINLNDYKYLFDFYVNSNFLSCDNNRFKEHYGFDVIVYLNEDY